MSVPRAEARSATSTLLRALVALAIQNASTSKPTMPSASRIRKRALCGCDQTISPQVLGEHPVIIFNKLLVLRRHRAVSLKQGILDDHFLDFGLEGRYHRRQGFGVIRRWDEEARLAVLGVCAMAPATGMTLARRAGETIGGLSEKAFTR